MRARIQLQDMEDKGPNTANQRVVTDGAGGFTLDPAAGHATGTLVVYDESSWLGVFEEMRFIGAGVAAYNSGSYVTVAITGSAIDLPATGSVTIYDEGFLRGQVYGMNFIGTTVEVVVSGTVAHVMHTGSAVSLPATGSVGIFDESILKGQATALNFIGTGVEAVMSGTIAHIMHTGTGGGAGHQTGTMVIYNEDTFLGVFEEMRFIGNGIEAFNSGTYVSILSTGTVSGGAVVTPGARSTYMLVGEPVPLDTITGAYWKVPTEAYATGSLNLFIDGLSQLAGTAFTEQHAVSGTFQWQFALPTGVILEAKWGQPIDQVSTTGTVVVYDDGALVAGGIGYLSFEETLEVSSSGSYAYIKRKQVGARVSKSSDQTISNTTDTAVIFDTEVHDYGACWISSTGTRLTAPIKGVYSIGGNVQFAAGGAATTRQVYVRVNGDSNKRACWEYVQGTNALERIGCSTNYELDEGDYIELMVYQNSGGNLDINANNEAFPHAWLTLLFET